jgi:phosphoserine phosphatase RsbU/P
METLQMYAACQTEQSQTGRVLLADDQPHVLDALQLLLKSHGYQTEAVMQPGRVVEALEANDFDAVLMDLNYTRDTTAGGEGLELVSQIRSIDETVPLVVMTAWSTVDLAVEAMRRGASDFVQKPWQNRQLLEKLQTQIERHHALLQAQRQRESELQDAREIQAKLLPTNIPQPAGYEIAGVSQPVRFVGGDYYDVIRIDDSHTAVCIADVAGKGLPAALLMSSLQAALKPLARQALEPRELCNRLNHVMCEITPVGKFISFFYAVLDHQQRRLTYCNAGHNPPIHIWADGTVIELNAAGAVLGQFPDWIYQQSELRLSSGDKLVLFTDGLVEASDDSDELFGEERVAQVARQNVSSGAEAVKTSLMQSAAQHCGGHFQDDASIIVVRVL